MPAHDSLGPQFDFRHYDISGFTGVQAFKDDEHLGGAVYSEGDDSVRVDSVVVEEAHRRQGVGMSLLKNIEETKGKPLQLGPGRHTKAGKALFKSYQEHGT